jgi:hypothetical protein
MQKSKKYAPLAMDGEYTRLVEATKVLRREIRKATGLQFDHYHRIFTEPRAYGLRSKYWGYRKDFPVSQVKKYIADNPVFAVGNSTYEVSMYAVPSYGPYSLHSYALYINKLNTTTKTA